MEKIVGVVTAAPKVRIKRDDDIVDRLSSRYTAIILVAFSIMVSFTQWVGKPITCWAPKHFTSSHIKYTNSYCWVRNTYYLPFTEYIPKPHEEEKRGTITYYQWIPWILLTQAMFFYLPSAVWHGLNSKAGVDSDDILESAGSFQNAKQAERKDHRLELVTTQLDRFLMTRTELMDGWKVSCKNFWGFLKCQCCGRRMGCYLVILWFISKVLYLVNVVAQLFVLNSIFQTSYNIFAYVYFTFYGEEPEEGPGAFLNSPIFPRVTMCDLKVRLLGNVQRYTVQCVLPINLFLEIMYLFLWFWMIMLSCFTGISLFIWFLRSVWRSDRLRFIRNHLNAQNLLNDQITVDQTEIFLDQYLRQDGAFLLRLISHNTNSITTTEIICSLFEKWREQLKKNSAGSELEDLVIDTDETASRDSIQKDPPEYQDPPMRNSIHKDPADFQDTTPAADLYPRDSMMKDPSEFDTL